jgi:hypothetical protein
MRIKKVKKSVLAETLFYLNGAPFSLDDYKHMRPIYDSDYSSIVLQTSRQISKCCSNSTKIYTYNRGMRLAHELKPGDKILSFDENSYKIVLNKVKNVEDNGHRKVYRIKTRTGRSIEVTGEHPI